VRHDLPHPPARAKRRIVPPFGRQLTEHLGQFGALGRDHALDIFHRCHVSFVMRVYVNATNLAGLRWTF